MRNEFHVKLYANSKWKEPVKRGNYWKNDQIRIKKTGKRKNPKKTEDRSPEIQRKKTENIVFVKR